MRSAEGYALERVNNAEGDAKRFDALYEEYRKAPAVTRKRIYLETHGPAAAEARDASSSLDDKAKGILPLLQLEGERQGGEAVKSAARRSSPSRSPAVAAPRSRSTPSPRPSR